jgi:hypothetical protein
MADETWATALALSSVVKPYIMPGETAVTTWDTPLQIIVDGVVAAVKKEVGCDIINGTYTSEEVSGTGRTDLPLKHWPILTVTTVTDIDSNTYTVGAENDYTVEDYCLRASTGVWAKGHENLIVTYTAGNGATVPRDILTVCLRAIAREYQLMKGQMHGQNSRTFPDGSLNFEFNSGFTKAELAVLAKYKRPRL